MQGFKGFLWLHFRRDTSTPGFFQSVPVQYRQHYPVLPCDILRLVHAVQPQLLCFEFDPPQPCALTAFLEARLRHPNLSVLLVTANHLESLAPWIFRTGVSDRHVKPLSAEQWEVRIAWPLKPKAGLEHSDSKVWCSAASAPAASPLPPCLPWHAPQQSMTAMHKTSAACEFVASHFAEVIRLALVADLCHMCTSEFSRWFKKENGHTFSDYLLKYRISRACELLSGRSVPVKTVAYTVGFNDLSYFARIFRRYVGTTPSAYQQGLMGNGRLTGEALHV